MPHVIQPPITHILMMQMQEFVDDKVEKGAQLRLSTLLGRLRKANALWGSTEFQGAVVKLHCLEQKLKTLTGTSDFT